MTTLYLVLLFLALALTLAFVVLWARDAHAARRSAATATGARWYDATFDRLFALFWVAAAGLLAGLGA